MGFNLKTGDKAELLLELGKRIVKGLTSLHKVLYKYFESETGTLKLVWNKTV